MTLRGYSCSVLKSLVLLLVSNLNSRLKYINVLIALVMPTESTAAESCSVQNTSKG